MSTNTQKQLHQGIEEKQNEFSSFIIKFIESVSIRNKNTAKQYHLRLLLFSIYRLHPGVHCLPPS